MNAKLEAIIKQASQNLVSYAREHEENILKAWHSVEDEAQANEETPKFKLGFSIVLDLDKDTMECALNWSVKFKASSVQNIPDPNQPELIPNDDGVTMTLKTEGHPPVTTTPEQLTKALNKLSKKK